MPLIVFKYFYLETETCGLVERGIVLYLLSPSHISILQKSEWHGGQKALLTETFFSRRVRALDKIGTWVVCLYCVPAGLCDRLVNLVTLRTGLKCAHPR